MAKRQFHLTPDEISGLWQAYDQADDPQEQRRWQAVRLYGEGWRVSEIEAITGCSETSLRRWARHYRQQGVDGLRSHWRGGNRARLSQAQREQIQALVHQSPPHQVLGRHQRRHDAPFWTVEDLMVVVEEKYGVRWHSRTSYLALMHESGLSVQRVSKRFRSRPSDQAIAEAETELEKK
jgi:transposase